MLNYFKNKKKEQERCLNEFKKSVDKDSKELHMLNKLRKSQQTIKEIEKDLIKNDLIEDLITRVGKIIDEFNYDGRCINNYPLLNNISSCFIDKYKNINDIKNINIEDINITIKLLNEYKNIIENNDKLNKKLIEYKSNVSYLKDKLGIE